MIIRVDVDTKKAMLMLLHLKQGVGKQRLALLFEKEGRRSQKNVRKEIGKRWTKSEYHSTGKPRKRTGNLRDSISYAVTQAPNEVSLDFGIVRPKGRAFLYAGVQEYGRTFRAKGKLLAIPLSPALTSRGLLRFRPLQAKRIFPRGTFIKDRIIYGRLGKKRIPLFKLKEENKVPGISEQQHQYLRPESSDLFDRIRDGISDLMREATGRAKG